MLFGGAALLAGCLFGGAGNDHIDGRGGDDTLIGDDGTDDVTGGERHDRCAGERLQQCEAPAVE